MVESGFNLGKNCSLFFLGNSLLLSSFLCRRNGCKEWRGCERLGRVKQTVSRLMDSDSQRNWDTPVTSDHQCFTQSCSQT